MLGRHTGTVNDTPLWDRVMAEFARRRGEFSDFEWHPEALVHHDHSSRHVAEAETLLAVSNGFIGVRGALEEDEPSYERATLFNGFHETSPIIYGERPTGSQRPARRSSGYPTPHS